MASFNSISTALVALLNTIPEIGEVKDYPTVEFSAWPGVCVFISGNENEFLDSQSNLVGYRFTIRTVDEMKTAPSATEARMRTLADLILAALDSSDDLSGSVEMLQPATISAGFQKSELGEFRVLTIDVVASAASLL